MSKMQKKEKYAYGMKGWIFVCPVCKHEKISIHKEEECDKCTPYTRNPEIAGAKFEQKHTDK